MQIKLTADYIAWLEKSSIVIGPKGEEPRKLTQKEVQNYVREVLGEHRASWEKTEE